MAKRDPDRTRRLRTAVRYLVESGNLMKGNQATLARHFHVSRQRVHQIVVEERRRLGLEEEVGEERREQTTHAHHAVSAASERF